MERKKAASETEKRIQQKVEDIIEMRDVSTDPLGSYTGVPEDRNENPVQDADDL